MPVDVQYADRRSYWHPGLSLGAFGDDSSVDIDTTPWYQVGQQLANTQAQLATLVAAMQADPTLAAQIGPAVTQAQADMGNATSQYQAIYTALNGSPDPGVSGILIPVATAAAIIALAAAVAIVVNEVGKIWGTYQANTIKTQVLGQAQTILTQAQQASNAGNTALANQLYAQYQQLVASTNPSSTGLAAWMQANGTYLIAAVAAVFIATKR